MNPELKNNEEIRRLLLENNRLLAENSELLRKMRRNSTISAIFKIIWLIVFFALPIYIYYVYLQPNITELQGQINSLKTVGDEASGLMEWYRSVKP